MLSNDPVPEDKSAITGKKRAPKLPSSKKSDISDSLSQASFSFSSAAFVEDSRICDTSDLILPQVRKHFSFSLRDLELNLKPMPGENRDNDGIKCRHRDQLNLAKRKMYVGMINALRFFQGCPQTEISLGCIKVQEASEAVEQVFQTVEKSFKQQTNREFLLDESDKVFRATCDIISGYISSATVRDSEGLRILDDEGNIQISKSQSQLVEWVHELKVRFAQFECGFREALKELNNKTAESFIIQEGYNHLESSEIRHNSEKYGSFLSRVIDNTISLSKKTLEDLLVNEGIDLTDHPFVNSPISRDYSPILQDVINKIKLPMYKVLIDRLADCSKCQEESLFKTFVSLKMASDSALAVINNLEDIWRAKTEKEVLFDSEMVEFRKCCLVISGAFNSIGYLDEDRIGTCGEKEIFVQRDLDFFQTRMFMGLFREVSARIRTQMNERRKMIENELSL